MVTRFPAAALDLLAERIRADAAPGRRFILGIAGSPGSGKSTLAAELVAALGSRSVHLPMDGFHLANRTLERLGLRDRKGAPETFDGWGFVALLERVRRELDHPVYAPSFRREVDEGIAAEITIDPTTDVVIVEGNYVLFAEEPWSRGLEVLDAAWFCAAPAAVREARLVARHTRHGRSVDEARAWAREIDAANAARIEPTAERADLIVSGEDGAILQRRDG